DLRNQPELHTFLEQLLETAEVVIGGNRFAGPILQVPVLANANAAIIHHQKMSRLELRNPLEHRLGPRHITQSQVSFQCVWINHPEYCGYLQQRFDFRSERQKSVALI